MTGKQIGYTVAGTAVAGLGLYFLYLQFWSKDEAVVSAPVADKPATVLTKAADTVKKIVTPVRKTEGFNAPVVTAPATTTAPSVRKMGDKAFAGTAGANAYKSASAGTTNVYKFYKAGSYIGTYLGTEGSFTKIIVEENGVLYGTNPVTVWVPTKDVTY